MRSRARWIPPRWRHCPQGRLRSSRCSEQSMRACKSRRNKVAYRACHRPWRSGNCSPRVAAARCRFRWTTQTTTTTVEMRAAGWQWVRQAVVRCSRNG